MGCLSCKKAEAHEGAVACCFKIKYGIVFACFSGSIFYLYSTGICHQALQ